MNLFSKMNDKLDLSDPTKLMVKITAISGSAFLIPFTINNVLQARWMLSLFGIIILTTLLVNAVFIIRHNRYLPSSIQFILLPCIIVFLFNSVMTQGIIGFLWCFPSVVSFYFLVPETQARVANAILLTILSPIAFQVLDPSLAIRVIATLFLVSVLSALFTNTIHRQQKSLEDITTRDPLTQLLSRTTLKSDLTTTSLQI